MPGIDPEMCFSSSSDSKIAKQQRADEVARQARIKAGMAQIAQVFDGTTKGVGAATAYDPSKTYYRADGTVFDPNARTSIPGPFGGMLEIPMMQDPNDLAKSGQLFTGVEHIGGFGDDYYNKRAEDYIDYATPDLERQAKEAREKLVYALSRTGNLDSSSAIRRNADLTTDIDKARIDVANKGLDYANQARSNVENTRSALVSELNATGDDSAAAQAALRQANNLNAPIGYSPLGDLFGSFAQTVAQIGSNAGNGYRGFIGGSRPLFGPSSGSQRVVG